MSTEYRLNKLYDSNVPAVREINDMCDSYKEWYETLIASLITSNQTLTGWYNTWKANYDPDITDVSLSTIYTTDKPLFSQLQSILNDQKAFFDSIKSNRLSNTDSISFVWDSSVNREKTLKNRYTLGQVSNLSSNVSPDNVVNTNVDTDLETNNYLVRHQYQVGAFNQESVIIDLHFGNSDAGNVSDLYNRIITATDGTSVVSQNNRMIKDLTFNISRCSQIQNMLTYIKK